MTRFFTTYSHTSFTLGGYEAPEKLLTVRIPQTNERKTGEKAQDTSAGGGINRLESYNFLRRLSREKGPEKRKGKREPCRRIETTTKKMRKRWGRRRKKSQRSREQNPKRSRKRTRTRYVQNPTGARGLDIVPHSAGATSEPGREMPGPCPRKTQYRTHDTQTPMVLPTTPFVKARMRVHPPLVFHVSLLRRCDTSRAGELRSVRTRTF